jgi:hypothetical protein
MTPTQEDRETWELYGPKVFHLDMTGPELVMQIRLAAEERGARMALEAAAKVAEHHRYGADRDYLNTCKLREDHRGHIATAIRQIDPASLGAE